MNKKCYKCNIIKPATAEYFHRNAQKKDGLRGMCKICRNVIKRDAQLKKLYGITLDEYNTLYELQDGKCAICGKHNSEFTKSLAVDHDHKTSKIRELLCILCNTQLGWYEKYKEIINKYLENNKS